jgi:anti-sigma B factor antagonist
MTMMLETEIFNFEPDITGISCAGRFTLGNRLSETEGLINSLIKDGVRKLVLDLTHVEFVDSAGLGVIMHAFGEIEQLGGRMRISGANERVERLFNITHTGTILTLDPDLVTSIRKMQDGKATSAGQSS